MEPLKVLIVDDEIGMRLGVQRVLKNFIVNVDDDCSHVSFEIDSAETGEEALEKIGACRPDILLLDHKLPGIQGMDILEELNLRKSGILTIMVTAYASIEVAITATKNGAYDFLAKPFTPDELKHAVSKGVRHLVLARRAEKLAEEKRQVRFEFISVLAHELKSPISAVEGYLNIMEKRLAGDLVSSYGNMISRSLIRLEGMRKLILDLLDLTRIESGKRNRILEKADINSILAECIENVRASADERGIHIETDVEDSMVMTADRSEIEIIFNNFLSNAVKYNRDNGRISIRMRKENNYITAQFADTGIGMKKDDVERLFGEFVRIKNEHTLKISGSGLGLSIVKKLVGLYDGTIEVSSVPGEGTVFSIKLKVDPEV